MSNSWRHRYDELNRLSKGCVYIELSFTHKSFKTRRTSIVAIPGLYEFIETYKNLAKIKVCKYLNLPKDEVIILDYRFLGKNVLMLV